MVTEPLNRSILYLPASNTRALEKSRGIEADSLVFDLEDSVIASSKSAARESLLAAFSAGSFGDSQTVIRCNTVGSADYLKDLETIRECAPDSVLLPKVSSTNDLCVFQADAVKAGLPDQITCWYMIETAAGVANLASIVEAGKISRWPVAALVVGHNDLAKETGVSLQSDRKYLQPWLMQIVLQAKAAQIHVFDSVWNDFKDLDGFGREALQGKQMGFDGKTLIHPSQVAIANKQFLPGAEELKRAREIIAAFALPENSDAGVLNLNGEMVERLHLRQALSLLESAKDTSAKDTSKS
ncbi:hypothetical protein AB833_16270 [Chromatiales bacterium (ex Bugula neritina AB1)]|nr:hypothetical protein AB833_16270 [Chromatiales bacterium (ex Bugula neritina AB1)]